MSRACTYVCMYACNVVQYSTVVHHSARQCYVVQRNYVFLHACMYACMRVCVCARVPACLQEGVCMCLFTVRRRSGAWLGIRSLHISVFHVYVDMPKGPTYMVKSKISIYSVLRCMIRESIPHNSTPCGSLKKEPLKGSL